MKTYDIVIIGGGPAGMSAAVEASKKGYTKIVLIEREVELGGILQQCIHSGFGTHEFNETLTGPAFAQRYIDLIETLGIEVRLQTSVTKINKDKTIELLSPDGFKKILAKAIVLAMGCRERARGAISIPGDRPSGVMSAGSAQKYLNMEGYLVGKKVFILGSGDIGLIMARRMHLEGAKVLGVAEVMPYSNGLTRNIVQCLNDFDIPLYLSHTVTKIVGKHRLEAIELSRVDHDLQIIEGTTQIIETDALLLSVGLVPDNALSEYLGITLSSQTKGPIVNNLLETSIEGIFACGNVLHVHDVVDFVVEEARFSIDGVVAYLNSVQENKTILEVVAQTGIGYVVPQKVYKQSDKQKQRFYFRVKTLGERVKIGVFDGEVLIKQYTLPHAIPAEMGYIELDYTYLSQCQSGTINIQIIEEVV